MPAGPRDITHDELGNGELFAPRRHPAHAQKTARVVMLPAVLRSCGRGYAAFVFPLRVQGPAEVGALETKRLGFVKWIDRETP